jgi:transcriptional regulator with XRE-family HTH domain
MPVHNSVKLHFWSMARQKQKRLKNLTGPQIRKLRYQKGMTQEMFAARCSVLGLDLSRATLSKIEAQLRCVTDSELVILAEALKVDATFLLPLKKRRPLSVRH